MALQKIKSTNFGVGGDYHRILQLNCHYDRLDAVCTVGTYIDQVARDEGNVPIDSFQIDLASEFHGNAYKDGEDMMKNISLKEAYRALKKMAQDEAAKLDDKNEALAFYADAEDV